MLLKRISFDHGMGTFGLELVVTSLEEHEIGMALVRHLRGTISLQELVAILEGVEAQAGAEAEEPEPIKPPRIQVSVKVKGEPVAMLVSTESGWTHELTLQVRNPGQVVSDGIPFIHIPIEVTATLR